MSNKKNDKTIYLVSDNLYKPIVGVCVDKNGEEYCPCAVELPNGKIVTAKLEINFESEKASRGNGRMKGFTPEICQAGKIEICDKNKIVGLTPDDIPKEQFAEIKDGLSIILARGLASELILSDEEVYKGLRKKFAIKIEVVPDDMLYCDNAVIVSFEDIDKYRKREMAKRGFCFYARQEID